MAVERFARLVARQSTRPKLVINFSNAMGNAMTRRNRFLVVFGSTLLLGLTAVSVGYAQIFSAVVREDEVLPGDPREREVVRIGQSAQNRVGGYAFSLWTVGTPSRAGGYGHIWGNATGGAGTILVSESKYGQVKQEYFPGDFGLSDSGAAGYSCVSTVSNSPGLSGVWVDSTLILNEGDPIPTVPGYFSVSNTYPEITRDGTIYWIGAYSTTQGGGLREKTALFLGNGATAVIKPGDSISGIPETVSHLGPSLNSRFSASGTNYISAVDVDVGQHFDDVMVSNGAAMTAGGSLIRINTFVPAAAGGLPNEIYSRFDFMNITDTGDYLIAGETGIDGNPIQVLMVNGQIILREGDLIDGFTLTSPIDGAYMNEDGDWAVIWHVRTPMGGRQVLILNGRIILMQGDLVDWNGDGVIDGADNGGVLSKITNFSFTLHKNAVTLGDRDANGMVNVAFVADIDFGGTVLEGGFFSPVLATLEPTCADDFAVDTGSVQSGGLADLCGSDDSHLILDPQFTGARYQLNFTVDGTAATATPSGVSFTLEARVFTLVGTVDQRIEMFNYVTGAYETVDNQLATSTDSVVTVTPAGDPTRFVEPGTRAMRARISYQNSLPFWVTRTTSLYLPYRTWVDQTVWSITP